MTTPQRRRAAPATWTLNHDDSSCVTECRAGVIPRSGGVEFTYALRFQFETTTMNSENEALIAVPLAHRTMIKSSNGDTPFSLTYGTEAVIPAEIEMPTFRTTEVDVAKIDEALENQTLDRKERKAEQAAIRVSKKQEAN
ncbi:hypothetical protein Tco_0324009 [Tanacetum coccineum]